MTRILARSSVRPSVEPLVDLDPGLLPVDRTGHVRVGTRVVKHQCAAAAAAAGQ